MHLETSLKCNVALHENLKKLKKVWRNMGIPKKTKKVQGYFEGTREDTIIPRVLGGGYSVVLHGAVSWEPA